jgi:hypothetical protein
VEPEPAPSKKPAAAAKEAKPATRPEPKKEAKKLPGGVTPEERYRMIQDAAYFRAEKRGFVGGDPGQDWIEAEQEIDALLRKRGKGT